MASLRGGGSRKRKAARQVPTTAAEISASRNACTRKKYGDTYPKMNARDVVKGTIAPASRGPKCVYFIERQRGVRVRGKPQPYRLTRMCNGGCFVDSDDHATLASARAALKFMTGKTSKR